MIQKRHYDINHIIMPVAQNWVTNHINELIMRAGGMGKAQAMYQIKITLNDTKPPVWRRLIVPEAIALNELHHVIQIAMARNWKNFSIQV